MTSIRSYSGGWKMRLLSKYASFFQTETPKTHGQNVQNSEITSIVNNFSHFSHVNLGIGERFSRQETAPRFKPLSCDACGLWKQSQGCAYWVGYCTVDGQTKALRSHCSYGKLSWQTIPETKR